MTTSNLPSTPLVISNNYSQLSYEKLCEIIVSHRYLGIMREEAIKAMEELAVRRGNGDQFPYEERIDTLLKELPKIDVDLNQLLKSLPNFKL